MDKTLWRKSYGSLPRLPCPRCGKGKLIRKGDAQLLVPEHTNREIESQGLQGELSEGRFIAFMVCDYGFCGEVATVAGDYRSEEHAQWEEHTGQEERYTITYYSIFSFRPAPPIIKTPKNLNSEAKRHLNKAYDLFWNDHASCANRLRIVVEFLLDQFQIERQRANGGYRSLSERLEQMTKIKPEQEEFLSALRWLGNAGSHDGVVDFEDLIICFDMLEHVMIELLDGRREKMSAEAKRIIASQGKPVR
ncbi:DUF4145 domain-containing protein [Hoeflea sp.]|uniref:DUF4145 domain-containing protein n=1 Tax=Hoeflea sp. TaxID=1940281 RepID=UPI003A92DEB7